MCKLLLGDIQPPKPVAFVGPGPERGVFLPKACYFIVFSPVLQRGGHRVGKIIRERVGLFVHAHARAPAVLPTASSRVLKASSKSFMPSASSLSVISFIEIPALARSAMVFAAPSTFSVRLGRNLPWSRKASNVAGGIVSTVSAPMSSST